MYVIYSDMRDNLQDLNSQAYLGRVAVWKVLNVLPHKLFLGYLTGRIVLKINLFDYFDVPIPVAGLGFLLGGNL